LDIHNLTEIIANQGFPIALSIPKSRVLLSSILGSAEKISRSKSRVELAPINSRIYTGPALLGVSYKENYLLRLTLFYFTI